jgi:hypothetical protein
VADPQAFSVIAVVVASCALLASVLLAARLARVTRALNTLAGDGGRGAFERQRVATEALRRDVTATREEIALARADLSDALRHVAVVRYDAFGDQGGRLSFSAALLDDAGDGLVLTSINARTETRTYAKGVKGGESDHELSPEEQQAIDYATRPSAGKGEPRKPKGRLSRT